MSNCCTCAGYHEMDLDWLIAEIKNALSEWDITKHDWEETKQYITDYFKNLDVSKEISDKLDQMAEDGSLSILLQKIVMDTMPPLVVNSTDEMTDINRTYILKTDSHVYQYQNNSWIDTGLIFGENIGNVFTFIGIISDDMDLNALQPQTIYIVPYNSVVQNRPTLNSGFVYTIGISQTIEQFFVETATSDTYMRSLTSDKWTEWTNLNNYNLKYSGLLASGSNANTVETQTYYICAYPKDTDNLPTDLSGFLITLGVDNSNTIQIYISILDGENWVRTRNSANTWTEWKSNCIKFKNILGRNTDVNTVNNNTVYLCATGYNYTNLPSGNSGFLYTIGYEDFTQQFYIETLSGYCYYRLKNPIEWSEWKPYICNGNRYAKMCSVGNSILTGSVYINGEMSHLSPYGSAPYSVISTALNIAEQNTDHTLMSGAGLLHNSGSGSFLDKIKTIDLKNYDCLLTHLYTEDMTADHPLGTVKDSIAGDGTIIGGGR